MLRGGEERRESQGRERHRGESAASERRPLSEARDLAMVCWPVKCV